MSASFFMMAPTEGANAFIWDGSATRRASALSFTLRSARMSLCASFRLRKPSSDWPRRPLFFFGCWFFSIHSPHAHHWSLVRGKCSSLRILIVVMKWRFSVRSFFTGQPAGSRAISDTYSRRSGSFPIAARMAGIFLLKSLQIFQSAPWSSGFMSRVRWGRSWLFKKLISACSSTPVLLPCLSAFSSTFTAPPFDHPVKQFPSRPVCWSAAPSSSTSPSLGSLIVCCKKKMKLRNSNYSYAA
mmetsp:Transcript_8893/g.21686  ORF Transcript_8893/g.21686 Transcript_8893/m.21686 type:complete len:242 (+) Transcript_8893:4138-4863(+)